MKNNNHTFKRVIACVMVVIMAVTAVPMSGFVGLELPKWSEMFATRVGAYYTERNYEYIVENSEATITYCDRSISGDVVIPDTLEGYPVTSIGSGAFYGCTGLTSVTIPNSVTSIGSDAFNDCTGLASIKIPDSVSSIGRDAFSGTAWFNAQPFGDVYAGKVYYKYKGTMLKNTSVVIKSGTKGIAESAFFYCDGLTSITIPDSVTNIGDSAFFACSGLTSIAIPEGVTSIGHVAFMSCFALKSITIPDSVTRIGEDAFCNCLTLTSVTIGNGVKTIPNNAFEYCPLTTIKIGKMLKRLVKTLLRESRVSPKCTTPEAKPTGRKFQSTSPTT